MEITRELPNNDVNLALKVDCITEQHGCPFSFHITLTEEHIAQIRLIAEMVKRHKFTSISTCDNEGTWTNNYEIENPTNTTMVISKDDVHWEGFISDGKTFCETEYVDISNLDSATMKHQP